MNTQNSEEIIMFFQTRFHGMAVVIWQLYWTLTNTSVINNF